MANFAPCKNCTKRHRLCHADCESYKLFKADIDKRREYEKAMKEKDYPSEMNLKWVKCDNRWRKK